MRKVINGEQLSSMMELQDIRESNPLSAKLYQMKTGINQRKITRRATRKAAQRLEHYVPKKMDIIHPTNLTLAGILQEYGHLKELHKGTDLAELAKYSTFATALVKSRGYLMYKDTALTPWQTVIDRNRDDFLQEVDLAVVTAATRIAAKVRDGKLTLTRTDGEVAVKCTFTHIGEMAFLEVFKVVYRDVKRDVLQWLGRQTSVSALSQVDTLHQSHLWEGQSDGQSLLDMVEDKAALLGMDLTGYVDAIQGSLTAAEYRFLVEWMSTGRKPYDDTKTQRKIVKQLQKLDLTVDEMQSALSELVYREQLTESRLSIKLHKLSLV